MSYECVIKLTDEDIGKYVYFTGYEEEYFIKGIIQSFDNDLKVAWVVYACDEDWDNFKNYTGVNTAYKQLCWGPRK